MPNTLPSTVVIWHNMILRTAAVDAVLFGVLAMVWPLAPYYRSAADSIPNHLEFLQAIGMMVCVSGIGYWIAAADPARHWLMIFSGLLWKVLGALWLARLMFADRFPVGSGVGLLIRELLFVVPFIVILRHARAQGPIVVPEPIVEEPIVISLPAATKRPVRPAVVWSSLQSTDS